MEFKMKYKIKYDLLPIDTMKRSGIKMMKVGFITDHDTGNINSTARGNISYFKRTADDSYASAHVFIDDKEILICIPCLEEPEKAWHVLYEKPKDNELFGDDANDIAIGLELCYFNDYNRTLEAYKKYIWFNAYLMFYHNLTISKITGHHILDPERKTDPMNALNILGKTFEDLLNDIQKEYDECMPEKKSWEQELGEKAIDSLASKGKLHNPEEWKKKDLKNEYTPLWLFFEMYNRESE